MKTLKLKLSFLILFFIIFNLNIFADDMCYEDTQTDGFCIGGFGFNCTRTIPIRNISDKDLSNVQVFLQSDGIIQGGIFSEVGVKDNEGNATADSGVNAGPFAGLGKNVTYNLDDMNGSTPEDTRDTYTYDKIGIDFTNKTLYASYTKDGINYSVELSNCDTSSSANSTTSNGFFDAWDIFRDKSYRHISTKIVNAPFQLSLASFNITNDEYETKNAVGGDINVSIYPRNSFKPVSNSIHFDANSSSYIATSEYITVNKAVKEAVVGFKLCATYNKADGFVLYPLSDCKSESDTIYSCDSVAYSGSPSWHLCYSSDNFAIRPEKFDISSTDTTTLADLPSLLRSGHNYTFTLKAYDAGSTTTTNEYNQTKVNLIISDSNITSADGSTTPMNGAVVFGTTNNFTFVDGISEYNGLNNVVNISFNDVGNVDLKIIDKNWAAIDNDDTTADCTSNGYWICGDKNITFIPHHFDLNTTRIVNNGGATADFTYIANLNPADNTTFGMTARVEVTVSAKNEKGNVTKNFSSGSAFYENPISITITPPNKSVGIVSSTSISAATLGFASGIKRINSNDSNLSQILRFNYPRTINNTINPFEVNATDINISASSIYSDPIDTDTVNITGIKNGLDNGKATFVYGRTHASRQRYDSAVGKANIYYDVFCSSSIGTNCDLSLLNTISPNKKRIDDTRWYINEDHNSSTDGNIGTLSGNLINVTTVSDGNIAVRNLTYTGSSYPYKTTMQNSASPWLIYNRDNPAATTNSFPVEFENQNDAWSGAHETNTTTQDVGTVKSNRRTMW